MGFASIFGTRHHNWTAWVVKGLKSGIALSYEGNFSGPPALYPLVAGGLAIKRVIYTFFPIERIIVE